MLMPAHLNAALMPQALVLDPGLQVTVIQEAAEHLVAKPLLLCLGDKSEACREAAIQLLVSLLQVHHTQLV